MISEKLIIDNQLKPFLKILGILSIVLFAIIPFQAVIYFISPPPTTVIEYFNLFQKNIFLGLLDLDLSLTVDNLIFIPVYIGLYFLFKERSKVLVTTGLIFSIVSVTLYVISREALFSMLNLSNQYAIATSETERTVLLTVGQTMLTIYNGTCFNVSYFLGGVNIILFSIAMLKSDLFTKFTGWLGLIMGILMLVPPTAGKIGFVLSFMSIIPLLPWLLIIALRFFKLSKI
ncbi:MAG: DUF4386 family protein [Bacteroidetes bacterium]|nr:DUF4386 family protein [Bacteroidota bacterium]